MKITNNQSLPEALVRAVSHDRYDGGSGDISVTTLIAPPQIRILKEKHKDDIVEDAADRIWSVMGSSVHYMIENAVETMKAEGEWDENNCISERRFYHEYHGKMISAQIDLYERPVLTDFKVTSVWTIKDALYGGGKEEWDAQLNIQRWLMMQNGIEDIDTLYICAIARDWNNSGNLRDDKYPPRAVNIEIPIWSEDKLDAYMQSRLNAHYSPIPIPCTPKDCWEKVTTYALMKDGRQSALRVMESADSLLAYAADKGFADMAQDPDGKAILKPQYSIVERPGERVRCESYCSVAPFCEQFKDWKND